MFAKLSIVGFLTRMSLLQVSWLWSQSVCCVCVCNNVLDMYNVACFKLRVGKNRLSQICNTSKHQLIKYNDFSSFYHLVCNKSKKRAEMV